ncbi:hypothetical protein BH18ACT4_BH18ACT4_09250 [soil metagenome]
MPSVARYIEFRPGEAAAVIEVMDQLWASRSGWINFRPAVNADDAAPSGSALFGRLFSASGPDVPVATWTPGERRRRGEEPPSVGIQHASVPSAKDRLAEMGRAVPDGWVVLQDHPKRGLVVSVPGDEDRGRVLDWLLGAAAALSVVTLVGGWQAAVYED